MKYFIGEFLGSKIMIVANNGYYFSPLSEILRDPLWGPQDRTFWDSQMNYFIGEFPGSKIMIAVKTVVIFHLLRSCVTPYGVRRIVPFGILK